MCRRRTSSGFIELRGLWVYKDSGEGAAVGAGKKGGGGEIEWEKRTIRNTASISYLHTVLLLLADTNISKVILIYWRG